MTRTRLIAPLFLLLFSASVFAQGELGLRFGMSNYLGDLAPRLIPSEFKPTAGIQYRYNINSKLKFRINGIHGSFSGDDNNSKINQYRNLSFVSRYTELGLELEYNLLPFVPGSPNFTFAPYVFVGVAGFRFNPQAEVEGGSYNLQPLGTEGQLLPGSTRKPYSLYSMSLPFGVGFKKSVSDYVVFSVEAGLRATLTDYLDDVSGVYADPAELANIPDIGVYSALLADRGPEVGAEPAVVGSNRGNPATKDWYGAIFVTISKRLGSAPCYTF